MCEKTPSPPSRRSLLRALGVSFLAATAGCQSGTDNGDAANTTDNRSRSTTEDATKTPQTGHEANDSAETTTVQEHTIIPDSPAATAGSRDTTIGRSAPTTSQSTTETNDSNATPTGSIATQTGTPTTESTTTSSESTATATETATDTKTATATATETSTDTETATPTPTTTPTATDTSTPTSTATATSTPTSTATPTQTPTETTSSTDESEQSDSFGEWAEKAPLPVVGSDAGGGVLDGKLHFFGGIETGVELNAVSRGFVYDPTDGEDGSWDRLPDLPRALWGLCGVATDDAIYSFGGAPQNAPYEAGPPTDLVFRYRPDDGWTNLSESEGVRCPYPNWVMGGVYNPDDGLIYCMGGGTGDHDAETATNHGIDDGIAGTYDERRLWTFDPESERVAEADLARMPAAKRWPTTALFEVDGKRYLYAIGGLSGTTGPTDSNFRYDIENGDWERAQPTPRPGTYATHSNPVIDGQAYLSHGMFWEGESTIDRYKLLAHRYDPVTDSFETDLPDPEHRRGGSVAGVVDGTLYVVGGHLKRFDENNRHDCTAYNEAYTPANE